MREDEGIDDLADDLTLAELLFLSFAHKLRKEAYLLQVVSKLCQELSSADMPRGVSRVTRTLSLVAFSASVCCLEAAEAVHGCHERLS